MCITKDLLRGCERGVDDPVESTSRGQVHRKPADEIREQRNDGLHRPVVALNLLVRVVLFLGHLHRHARNINVCTQTHVDHILETTCHYVCDSMHSCHGEHMCSTVLLHAS